MYKCYECHKEFEELCYVAHFAMRRKEINPVGCCNKCALAPLICTGDMMIIDTNAPLQHGDIAAQTDGKPVIYYTHNAPILGKVIGITRTEV